MRTVIYFIACVTMLTGVLWAKGTFVGDDCVHCGGEQGNQQVEISDMDTIVFCNSHKSGAIQFARDHGKNVFGSLEAYYKNYHRIQCPPYYPSPLYHSIEEQPYEEELIKELEYISEILTQKERARLLNRPDKGRRKATILDMADISYKRSVRNEFDESIERYGLIRSKLEEMGAKRSDELSPDQLALYD